MLHQPSTTLALLAAAAYLPSAAWGCVFFNATLHTGARSAASAQDAIAVADAQKSGAAVAAGDRRLDLYLWDDVDNDNVVEPLKDSFCHGKDLKPYKDNTWAVPCEPVEKNVELDIVYDPDITKGGILVNILKYNNPRAQSQAGNDPDRDLIYTFNVRSDEGNGDFFEGKIFCNDCKGSSGQPVKC